MDPRFGSARARLASGLTCIQAKANRLFHNPWFRRVLAGSVVVFSFAVMGYLVYQNWPQLREYRYHLREHYPLIILSFLLYPTGFVPTVIGWHKIMKYVGGVSVFKINARIYCYTCLARRIPGGVWHIAGRAYLNKEQGVRHSLSVLGSALEWTLMVMSGLFVYLLTTLLPVSGNRADGGLSPGVAFALLLPLIILLSPPVINRTLRFVLKKWHGQVYQDMSPADVLGLMSVYLLAWIAGGMLLYILIRALYPLAVTMLPAVIGAWAGASAMGLIAAYLIQGLGVREVTLAVMLSAFMPLPVGIITSILFRLLLTAGEIVWPLVWARFLR
jgi:hypothetical protein